MKENAIKLKSYDFALRIVNLYKYLIEEKREFVLSKQLLRSGTCIGAMIRESKHAESKPDFIHKLSIALKEANETQYWIELLYKSNFIDEKSFQSIQTDITELLKLLQLLLKAVRRIEISFRLNCSLIIIHYQLSIINCLSQPNKLFNQWF